MELGHLELEQYFHQHGARFVAGVDEVGRGPLAGPVLAAACVVPPDVQLEGVRDSKALSPRARKKLFWTIVSQCVVGIGVVSERGIDDLNILQASLLAMRRAVLALPITPDLLLVDGNARINLPLDQVPIVDGDKQVVSISAASIVAKVTRDEKMVVLDQHYPHYGFKKHKGYPTSEHRLALEEWGPSPVHRMSFAPVEHARARVKASKVSSKASIEEAAVPK
jgi:ribonuclease HII